MTTYKYLEQREGHWRFKTRNSFPIKVIQGMLFAGDKKEDVAKDLDLPVEAIDEAKDLFDRNPTERNKY